MMEIQQELASHTHNSFSGNFPLKRYICKVSPAKRFERSLTPIIEHLEKLVLSTNDENEKGFSEYVTKYPAGSITQIFTGLGLVLVEPYSTDSLLYMGTYLFLRSSNPENAGGHEIVTLGQIDDIFGRVTEPMYSVCLEHKPVNSLSIGQEVYYAPNHPKTRCIYICEEEKREITCVPRCKKLNHIE